MILQINSDAAHLVEPGAKSCLTGYFKINSGDRTHNDVNRTILIECCKTL